MVLKVKTIQKIHCPAHSLSVQFLPSCCGQLIPFMSRVALLNFFVCFYKTSRYVSSPFLSKGEPPRVCCVLLQELSFCLLVDICLIFTELNHLP